MFSKSNLNLFGTGNNTTIAFHIPILNSCQFESPPPCLPKCREHPCSTLELRFQLLLLHDRGGRGNLLTKLLYPRRMVNIEKVPKDSLEGLERMCLDLSFLAISKVLGNGRIVYELLCKIDVVKPAARETEDNTNFCSSVPSGFLNNDSFLTRLAASLRQDL